MKKKKITNKKRLKNREKGITLIALIVTIIILLILAGVSIAMLTGENGILTQAQRAKNETENTHKNEELILKDYEDMINGNYIEIKQVTDENPGILEGSGTESDPYTINSIEDLVVFSYNVRNANTYEGEFVNLGLSLDFSSDKSYVNPETEDYSQYGYNGKLKELLTSGSGFLPIGQYYVENGEDAVAAEPNSFKGTFNGNNNAIKNLYINRVSEKDNAQIGLFGSNFGEIKDLGLVNVNIQAQGVSTILGGVVGDNYKNVSNCYTTGKISCNSTLWSMVGGITGILEDNSKVTKCYNEADISHINKGDAGQALAAGIAGCTEVGYAEIIECYNNGIIYAESERRQANAAGIVAAFKGGKVNNCYNKGRITSKKIFDNNSGFAGGILGSYMDYDEAELKNCYNVGEIIFEGEVDNTEIHIGGIAGYAMTLKTNNVYNLGNINIIGTNKKIRIGGIFGFFGNSNIQNAYNRGKIIAEDTESESIGGFIGDINSGTFNECYYLTGIYDESGGNGSSTGIQELDSIDKFPSVLSVVNGEEAFKEDVNNINNGYPILVWQ